MKDLKEKLIKKFDEEQVNFYSEVTIHGGDYIDDSFSLVYDCIESVVKDYLKEKDIS